MDDAGKVQKGFLEMTSVSPFFFCSFFFAWFLIADVAAAVATCVRESWPLLAWFVCLHLLGHLPKNIIVRSRAI